MYTDNLLNLIKKLRNKKNHKKKRENDDDEVSQKTQNRSMLKRK